MLPIKFSLQLEQCWALKILLFLEGWFCSTMKLKIQGASIRTSSTSISLVLGLTKKQRNSEVMIFCRTRVQSEVSRVYLAKTFHSSLLTEDGGEGRVALGRGLTVLICIRRVSQIATFDYYLMDIFQLTGNQILLSVIFPADGELTPEKHTNSAEISPLRSSREQQQCKMNPLFSVFAWEPLKILHAMLLKLPLFWIRFVFTCKIHSLFQTDYGDEQPKLPMEKIQWTISCQSKTSISLGTTSPGVIKCQSLHPHS